MLPTVLARGETATYRVIATNSGSVVTSGALVKLTDTLPPGVDPDEVQLYWSGEPGEPRSKACEIQAPVVRCRFPHRLAPDATLTMSIQVTVEQSAETGLMNTASVTGAGIPAASVTEPDHIAEPEPPFGVRSLTAALSGLDGTSEVQAGGHPYEMTARIDLNTTRRVGPEAETLPTSVHDLRDVVIELPPGLLVSTAATPMCTLAQLSARASCPADTTVGQIQTEPSDLASLGSPIYNLTPEPGVAAEFGYRDGLGNTHVLYGALAPTPAGYALTLTAREVPQVGLDSLTVRIYGDPANRDRSTQPAPALLTSPADCRSQPLQLTVYMDSWQAPGATNPDGTPNLTGPGWVTASTQTPPVTGCELLDGLFTPMLTGQVDTAAASTPTGLTFELGIPQQEANNIATPPLREAVVTLPEGVMIDPSVADGLTGCSEAEAGYQGATPAQPGELQDFEAGPETNCPDSSKIGTIEMETPILPAETCRSPAEILAECPGIDEREATSLDGNIYLAQPDANPFGSLLAIYLMIDDRRTGTIVKIPAQLQANPSTGQLTLRIPELPQIPFKALRARLFNGASAPLQSPPDCGLYTIAGQLTPWSSPQSGPPAQPSGALEVTEGPGGRACQSPAGFSPAFLAGAEDSQAGAPSSFTAVFSRSDEEQTLASVAVTAPPGLSASLRGIVRCPEPQASRGDCEAGSLVGDAVAAAGVGPRPYWLRDGRVYLTGPYDGAPFGLAIVLPVDVGPFALGDMVVRASVRVDPSTGQISILAGRLPQMIDTTALDSGIPVDLRALNVTLDRPGLIGNPTNCGQLTAVGRATSAGGSSASALSPFHASGCASLSFAPKLSATTTHTASAVNGIAVTLNITYPHDSAGIQARLSRAGFQLPAQLAGRLSTIQQACLSTTFETNPAGCPAASVIGRTTMHSQLLAAPLVGPVYFVSHGATSLPEVVLVLQGEGVTVQLHGQTSIDNRTRRTSVTFTDLPDLPFETLRTVFPAGPNSEFGASLPASTHNSLCGQKLTMSSALKAQDGVELHPQTPIQVTGCPERIVILSHHTHGHVVTVSVFVPHKGTLEAKAKGLTNATAHAGRQQMLTMKMRALRPGTLNTRLRVVLTADARPIQSTTLRLHL
jgi:uncharacterized repeat protein (TIGR01451 family)